ncbi:MAG: hypothetical protein KC897_12065, partial [Candidatus Omnitrophica bacterium]|nr:hypothetical protein [Candidatus Omnitrophota bacterium]
MSIIGPAMDRGESFTIIGLGQEYEMGPEMQKQINAVIDADNLTPEERTTLLDEKFRVNAEYRGGVKPINDLIGHGAVNAMIQAQTDIYREVLEGLTPPVRQSTVNITGVTPQFNPTQVKGLADLMDTNASDIPRIMAEVGFEMNEDQARRIALQAGTLQFEYGKKDAVSIDEIEAIAPDLLKAFADPQSGPALAANISKAPRSRGIFIAHRNPDNYYIVIDNARNQDLVGSPAKIASLTSALEAAGNLAMNVDAKLDITANVVSTDQIQNPRDVITVIDKLSKFRSGIAEVPTFNEGDLIDGFSTIESGEFKPVPRPSNVGVRFYPVGRDEEYVKGAAAIREDARGKFGSVMLKTFEGQQRLLLNNAFALATDNEIDDTFRRAGQVQFIGHVLDPETRADFTAETVNLSEIMAMSPESVSLDLTAQPEVTERVKFNIQDNVRIGRIYTFTTGGRQDARPVAAASRGLKRASLQNMTDVMLGSAIKMSADRDNGEVVADLGMDNGNVRMSVTFQSPGFDYDAMYADAIQKSNNPDLTVVQNKLGDYEFVASNAQLDRGQLKVSPVEFRAALKEINDSPERRTEMLAIRGLPMQLKGTNAEDLSLDESYSVPYIKSEAKKFGGWVQIMEEPATDGSGTFKTTFAVVFPEKTVYSPTAQQAQQVAAKIRQELEKPTLAPLARLISEGYMPDINMQVFQAATKLNGSDFTGRLEQINDRVVRGEMELAKVQAPKNIRDNAKLARAAGQVDTGDVATATQQPIASTFDRTSTVLPQPITTSITPPKADQARLSLPAVVTAGLLASAATFTTPTNYALAQTPQERLVLQQRLPAYRDLRIAGPATLPQMIQRSIQQNGSIFGDVSGTQLQRSLDISNTDQRRGLVGDAYKLLAANNILSSGVTAPVLFLDNGKNHQGM